MSNNSQHIEEGRSAAMENYVDFNGSSADGTTSTTTTLAPISTKNMTLAHIGIFVAGFFVGYYVCKMNK